MKILERRQMRSLKGGLYDDGGAGGCLTCSKVINGVTINAACTKHTETVNLPGGGSTTTSYCTCNETSWGVGCGYSSLP